MRSTLMAVFEDPAAAERAREELLRAGFADDEVDLRLGNARRSGSDPNAQRAYDDETQNTAGETVAGWFRSLFHVEEDADLGVYVEAARRGESVVAVHAGDPARVDRANAILERCGSVDIDEKARAWRVPGRTPGGAGP